MDAEERIRRIQDIRRRLHRMSLFQAVLAAGTIVGLYFVVPLSEVLAVAVLMIVGLVALRAVDRQLAAAAARVGELSVPAEPPRVIGPRRARRLLLAMMGGDLALMAVGAAIGHSVKPDERGVVVGGISGMLTGYAAMLIGLRLFKRLKSGS
jgi:hypothetical protein